MPAARTPAARSVWSKVPEITLMFWVAKLLTTGMGETTWDWFDGGMGQALAVTVTGALFVASMVVQFTRRAYNPWSYWFAIVMVSVFGTTVADLVHNDFGVPYTVTTGVALLLVGACFALWYRVEGTLSIHSIHTRRREAFYWAAVLLTFALGTAAGDWTASTLHLGYAPSGFIFLVAFLLPAVAYRWLGLGAIPAFWLSYVMTRPLGASFADYFGGPRGRGGLALGMDHASIVSTVLILAVVIYFAVSRSDRPQPLEARTEAGSDQATDTADTADPAGSSTRR